MTREEIIEQLDGIVGTYEILIGNGVNSDILDVDDIEAIREAISALSDYEKMQEISLDLAFENDELINKSRWIPVSERLPKPYEQVLRTVKTFGWNGTYHIYVDLGTICPADCHNVIAWMPLPEPYKGEDEDGEENDNRTS